MKQEKKQMEKEVKAQQGSQQASQKVGTYTIEEMLHLRSHMHREREKRDGFALCSICFCRRRY